VALRRRAARVPILFDLDGVLVDCGHDQAVARSARPGQTRCGSCAWRPDAAPGRCARRGLDIAVETRADAGGAATDVWWPSGAVALLASIPAGHYGRDLREPGCATLRLRTVGLPIPGVLVTGDEGRRGKPDPEPYLLGARRAGVAPADCLVVEDSPAGVASGKAAGMRVVAVTTTHRAEELGRADAVLSSLSELRNVMEGR
jgi:sugar-phosphatase